MYLDSENRVWYTAVYLTREFLERNRNVMTHIIVAGIEYHLPDVLEIDPALIIDEESRMLRIAVGKPDVPEDQKPIYDSLFTVLEPLVHEPFSTDISFIVGDKKLHFKVAYVSCIKRSYGMFFDIETTLNEYSYKEHVNERKVSKSSRSKIKSH